MSIRNFKLYHFPASRSARVLWALYELADCPVEVEHVDVYAGAQFAPEFLARNPNHAVPALDIQWADGRAMTMVESAGIVAFLGDAYPQKLLAPPPGDSPERADYMQMLHFLGAQVDMVLWQIRIHEHVLPKAESDAATIARYRKKMRTEIEPQILRRIEKGGFICGETFTVADCVAAHAVTWARGYAMAQDEAFRAYLSRCAKRPAFARAFADARQFQVEPPENAGLRTRFTG